MFKVIISKIFPKIDSSDPIELHNPRDVYEFRRRIKYDINNEVGPFLVRIIECNDINHERFDRAHICYNGEGISNFVRRTIEQHAITLGMPDVFNR